MRAANIHSPPVELSDRIDAEFWQRYEKKILLCHSNDEKRNQIIFDLSDTIQRLFDPTVEHIRAESTRWICDDVLLFNPKLINDNITSEQQASLRVMHVKEEWSSISVIIDLSEVTWSLGLRITRKASFNNIIDGLRLWSTIPHSIRRIHIIRPTKDYNFEFIYNIAISRLVSEKLRQRIHVHTSLQEVLEAYKEC